MPRKSLHERRITETHPDKIKFWDYSRNTVSPVDFHYRNNTKVWWVCDVDPAHCWFQGVADFCKRQTDCMYCTRRAVPEHVRLSTRYPEIARQWHPDLNQHLSPDTVRALAKRTAWWVCPQVPAHEWCSLIYARTKLKEGCPYCLRSRVKRSESLAAVSPELATWWSEEDNQGLTPQTVLASSSVVVRWSCDAYDEEQELGHKFSARIDSMVERGLVCHLCNREARTPSVTLAQGYPELAAQWHRTKNQDITPEDVKCGSGMLIWWQCDVVEDHEWRISVTGRTSSDSGCPFCAKRNISSTHSLAVDFPDIAAEWHSSKNGDLTPHNIQPTSLQKVWWRCLAGSDHVWKATVCDRTEKQTGCPFCANQAISATNTLAALYPDIAAEWHKKRNGNLTPKHVVAGSGKKVWWQCRINKNHEWEAIIAHRTNNGTGCPKCVSLRTPEDESLKALSNVAREWHPTKNGKVTPDMVRPLSGFKYWWQCRKDPSHSWQATPANRVGLGSGCPYCAGKIVTKETSLKAIYPELARQWHKEKNGDLRPEELLPQSNKKIWWRCNAGPDHEWCTSPNDRVSYGTGCPFCSGNRFSITNSLAITHPEIAKLWHPTKNKKRTPEMVTRGDTRAVWWICELRPSEHVWKSAIHQRVAALNPCPKCYWSKVRPGNTLQSKFPKVAKQWHKTKNGDLTPSLVSPASAQKVWWQCPVNKNHVWQATVTNRTYNRSGCPDCWRNR